MTAPERSPFTTRRIILVKNELRGSRPVGGIGTGATFLALGLARMGHDVEMLHFGTPATQSVDPHWQEIYERAGIRITFVPPTDETIEPRYFARLPETARALQADSPDIVIAQDTSAPVYVALRLRQLGLGFQNTAFIVVCYGTRLWIKDVARMARVFPYLLGVGVLEGAAIELADAVVSPSRAAVDWMQAQGLRLPKTLVIPYLSRSAATGELPSRPSTYDAVARLAFFGRLEERKGLRQFAAAINALSPEILQRLEVEFLGAATKAWPIERIAGLFSAETRASLRKISFETELDQPDALERLARPGTLAVMPSQGESFGNAVYECLEHGIPFISSNAGATPELVAAEDHPRVLFEPTADSLAAALRRVLMQGDVFHPARPAFDLNAPYRDWADLLAIARPAPQQERDANPAVDVVIRRGSDAASTCLRALERQTYRPANVSVVGAAHVYARLAAPFVVFLDAGDEPEPEFIALLVRAQAASDADVVTCGLRLDDPRRQHLFLGDPDALGILSNSYGGPALVRRSILDGGASRSSREGDPDWLLLAQLHLSGRKIVSIPLPLVTRRVPPGSLERHPADALFVAEQHEHVLPEAARSLARLAAGLAAATAEQAPEPDNGIIRRVGRRARRELFGR